MVGLGPADSFTLEQARLAAAAAVKAAGRGGVRRLATIVHGAGIGGLDPEAAAAAVAEGSVLGAYRFDGYKGAASQGDDDENGSGRVEELHIVEMDEQKTAAIERGVRRGQAAAEATNFARDLVNTPPNRMTPADLAARAQAMAAEEGLECRVLERDEMERLGMGILLGVAQGSAQPPKLVAIRYEGAYGASVLGLVGKGVTFDSGGLSLKPPGAWWR